MFIIYNNMNNNIIDTIVVYIYNKLYNTYEYIKIGSYNLYKYFFLINDDDKTNRKVNLEEIIIINNNTLYGNTSFSTLNKRNINNLGDNVANNGFQHKLNNTNSIVNIQPLIVKNLENINRENEKKLSDNQQNDKKVIDKKDILLQQEKECIQMDNLIVVDSDPDSEFETLESDNNESKKEYKIHEEWEIVMN